MKRTYIFGNNSLAEILEYYLKERGVSVAGYTLNEEYIGVKRKQSEKLVAIEKLLEQYSPAELEVYVTIAYKNMNQPRKKVFAFLKDKGITIGSYIHSSAVVASNAALGEGNIVLEGATIQPYVQLGDGNIIWNGVNISHHSVIGDFNYFAPGAVILGRTGIGSLNFLGANCTVSNDIHISEKCILGAGAYVSQDMQSEQVYVPCRGEVLKKSSNCIELV